jgi:hypothetical protein
MTAKPAIIPGRGTSMRAALLTLVLMLCVGTAGAQVSTSDVAPIRTHEALQNYLLTATAGQSPLDRLSPLARQRFLDTLRFGHNGVLGFNTEELEEELTDAQILPILQLFDLATYASAIHGLPTERVVNCASSTTCTPSDLERDFYAFRAQTDHITDAREAARLYSHDFARRQRSQALASSGGRDLRLLFRAADFTANVDVTFEAHTPAIADMQRDLDEMQRRGVSRARDVSHLMDVYISDRQFDAAQALARQHPSLNLKVPPSVAGIDQPHSGPTMLSIGSAADDVRRQPFETQTSAQIIVIAGCHLAADAARKIEADPKLAEVFRHHAIWLAPQQESITQVREWNSEHAAQPIHIAWRESDWPMIDEWGMPTFYIFQRGEKVGKVVGWSLEALRTSLRQVDLIQ